MTSSADPDQLSSEEANWSGSTLLQRQGISGFSRTRVRVDSPTLSVLPSRIKQATTSENEPSDVRLAKIQITLHISTVCSESSLVTFWIAKDAKFLHVDNKDWSDCTNA